MRIRALVMDVDGTLTDGGIYICESGESFKKFNVKDGYGVHNLLPQYGIIPIIITGKKSSIVAIRAAELGIDHIIQGSKDKVADLSMIAKELGLLFEQIAYIGDDLNDLDVMKMVGIKGCPSDAANEIISICDYVCKKQGGDGAVREFIEWMIKEGE